MLSNKLNNVGFAISLSLVAACADTTVGDDDVTLAEAEGADASEDAIAASATPTQPDEAPALPPRIAIDPPTSEAKPPGWDAASCPSGQTQIVGTAGDDLLSTSNNGTCLVGLEGNDHLTHSFGGGDRTALGGPGDDTITASSSTEILADGGEGDDHIILFGGPNEVYGDIGADLLYSGNDDDQIFGGPGDDDIFVSGGPDIIDAGEGNDYILGGNLGDVVLGGPGADHIIGGFGADHIDGGEGDDTILGYGGADLIKGGPGDDDIDALGFGGSTIEGNAGDDHIDGSTDDDVIIPGLGADQVSAGFGDDVVDACDVRGLVAGEVLDGGAGTDTLLLPIARSIVESAGISITSFEDVRDGTNGSVGCPQEAVYAQNSVITSTGAVQQTTIIGTLDDTVRQHLARPDKFSGEDNVYDLRAGVRPLGNGLLERTFVVTRRHDPGARNPLTAFSTPARTDIALDSILSSSGPSDVLEVSSRVSGLPDWDIPLLPSPTSLPVDEYATAVAAREQALADRKSLFDTLVQPTETAILAAGGQVTSKDWRTGWIAYLGPKSFIEQLAQGSGVDRTVLNEQLDSVDAGDALGEIRSSLYANADVFWQRGFTGSTPDPGSGFGSQVLGVVESFGAMHDMCALSSGPNCSGSRVLGLFDCSGQPPAGSDTACVEVSDVPDAPHATVVTASALADYTNNQGDHLELGDPEFGDPGHSDAWERRASGMARGASLLFAMGQGPNLFPSADRFGDAYVTLAMMGADVVNASHDLSGNGTISPRCTFNSSSPSTDSAEIAFDEGALFVTVAGNVSGASQSTCNMAEPGVAPKALAVNAVDISKPACRVKYNDCLLDTSNSARGGADVTVQLDEFILELPGAMSGVDLVAPNRFSQVTVPPNSFGPERVSSSTTLSLGTSFAAPIVSGLALLIKDWHLTLGLDWIRDPGRLHTVMLAMGDRHYDPSLPGNPEGGVTEQRFSEGDPYYGFGKIRLRLFDSGTGESADGYGYQFVQHTFVEGGEDEYTFYPFRRIPEGAEMLKCVSFAVEDVSHKSAVGVTELQVELRGASGQECSDATTSDLGIEIVDDAFDVKHMIAFEGGLGGGGLPEGNIASIEGTCPKVTLRALSVAAIETEPSSRLTVNVACYYDDNKDDE